MKKPTGAFNNVAIIPIQKSITSNNLAFIVSFVLIEDDP